MSAFLLTKDGPIATLTFARARVKRKTETAESFIAHSSLDAWLRYRYA
jgi:hypothetical protein